MLLGKRLTRPLLPASHATPPSKRVPIHELPSVRLPSNQDEAVTEAASCISMRGLKNVQVKTAAKVKSKGFSSPSSSPSPAAPVASSTRKDQAGSITIGVELPIEPSPAALASLASQIAKKLDLAPSKAVLIAADPMVLNEYKKGKGQQCLGLQEACRQDQLSGVLLLIGLKVEDVALVDQLVSEVATGSTCIFVNCDFRGAPQEYQGVVDRIDVVWSFLPVEFSLGMLGSKEGAVLRSVGTGNDAWRILYKLGEDRLVQVGKAESRPSIEEVESVIINASAATSQTNQMIRGLKSSLNSLLPQKKG